MFLTRSQKFFFALLIKIGYYLSLYASPFWRENPFKVALSLTLLIKAAARLILLFIGASPYGWPFLLFELLLFFTVYRCLFFKEEEFFLNYYSFPPIRALIEAGCRAEGLLFKREYRGLLFSFLLSLVTIFVAVAANLLDPILGFTLRSLLAFYLVIRTFLLYESRREDSIYMKEIPGFGAAVEVYNDPDLYESKEVYFPVFLFFFIFFVMGVGCLDKHGWLGEGGPVNDDPTPSPLAKVTPSEGAANGGDDQKTGAGGSLFKRGAVKVCALLKGR